MVRIVTDSTCDLTHEQAAACGIDSVAHLYVIFGDKSYRDTITITTEQFHVMLKSDPNFPTTSQPSVGDFAQIYEQYKGDPIVSIHVSRDLSGTIASAEAARDMVKADVTIIDSRNVNAGLALLVIEAVKLAKQGATPAQIKKEIEALVPRTRLTFALDTLENLQRGGRIGKAQAFLAGVMQFKPIITVKDGRLEPVERVRTSSKAVARLCELSMQDLAGKPAAKVAFMHTASPNSARDLMNMVAPQVKLDNPLIIEAGPVVATHAGPGAVGIAYIA
jgi:DegV family protein with EDD domain